MSIVYIYVPYTSVMFKGYVPCFREGILRLYVCSIYGRGDVQRVCKIYMGKTISKDIWVSA